MYDVVRSWPPPFGTLSAGVCGCIWRRTLVPHLLRKYQHPLSGPGRRKSEHRVYMALCFRRAQQRALRYRYRVSPTSPAPNSPFQSSVRFRIGNWNLCPLRIPPATLFPPPLLPALPPPFSHHPETKGNRAGKPGAYRAYRAGIDVPRAGAWAGPVRGPRGAVKDLRHARPKLQLRPAGAGAGGDGCGRRGRE